MKHLLIACVALLFATAAWAQQPKPKEEKIDIEFIKGEETEDYRSITITPTASYEGNCFFIYSPESLQNVQIVVKSATGEVVYFNVTSIPAQQEHSFMLNSVETGDYILEVTYGNTFLYGYVTL